MGSECPFAIDLFVPVERTFIGARPRGAIVIHKTAGFQDVYELGTYFATTPEETSSTFGIGLDGTIAQYVSLNNGAAANCCLKPGYDSYWDQYEGVNLNKVTMSIEHIDPSSDNSTPVTAAQLAASIKLCLWLRDNFDMEWQDVKTHASIDPVDRARCPGNYPMDILIAAMKPVVKKVSPPVLNTPVNKPITAAMDTSFRIQWRSVINDLRFDTGFFHTWCQAKANGKNLNAPTSREYVYTDWNGGQGVAQEGGNWTQTLVNGTYNLYTL